MIARRVKKKAQGKRSSAPARQKQSAKTPKKNKRLVKGSSRYRLLAGDWRPKRPLLKKLRDEMKLPQPAMAKLIGVSTRQISAIETGVAKPSSQTQRNLTELSRLHAALAEVIRSEHIADWFDTPNDAFGGLKPTEVIDRGEIDRLWRMIFYLQSGA